MFWNQYPYINMNDLNLDFLLKAIGDMENEVENFVSINAIKYADPIQWNITSQYEKNTIVIDPQSGTAYISVAPVPVGVALTNTDFWTVVFDLERFVTKANGNFTLRVEEQTTLTATFPTPEGAWVVWGGVLYEALTNIIAGDQYVEDSNIKRLTVEEAINNILTALANEALARTNADDTLQDNIDAEALARTNADDTLQDNIDAEALARANADGDLNVLTTTNKSNLVAAINEVNSTGGGAIGMIGDLTNLHTEEKNTIVGAINEVDDNLTLLSTKIDYITPEDFGAIGDGVTDDSDALIACFASDEINDKYIKLRGIYLITKQIPVKSNTVVKGGGIGSILDRYIPDDTQGTYIDWATFALNTVDNIVFDGVKMSGTGAKTKYDAKYMFLLQDCTNVYFNKCNLTDYPGASCIYARHCDDIWIKHCYIKDYTRAAINFVEGTSNSGVLFCKIIDGHETNTPNRYPIMICGYDQAYSRDNRAPEASRLFAIGNYLYDTNPWWEGIDAHGGNNIYVAYNRTVNISRGLAIFTNLDLGFIAQEVHVHDNDIYCPTNIIPNVNAVYGSSFGGSRFWIHHNRFRNGGQARQTDNCANIYFNQGNDMFFESNTVENGYGAALLFSGEFSQCYIRNNNISQRVDDGNATGMIKFITAGSEIYTFLIKGNSFRGNAPIVKGLTAKTTTNQIVKLSDNEYNVSSPTYDPITYVKPDKATAAQITNSTCGENGDICLNASAAANAPMGWIMTGSTHGTGTWRALPTIS